MSFIQDYLLTCQNSQPPIEYHKWCMLSTLSVFAGRRFWFPFGHMNFYPNLYVLLVGDPAYGKSTAMNRAKGIVRASGVCPVAATKITKEALAQEMTGTDKKPFTGQKFYEHPSLGRMEYNQYAIFATELTTFISVDPLGFLDFLTAIWDEPIYEVKTKNMGCDFINGPYITMLGCMTPELVKGFLKMNILQGGFARRTAFVHANYKNSVPIPSYSEEQRAAEKRCVEFGKRIQTKSGQFSWTPALEEYYIEWFKENERNEKDRHPATQGWYRSKAEMLFKVSMLVSLANEEGDMLVLDIPHWKMAQHYCAEVEKSLERVFEGTGVNENANVAVQICRMIEGSSTPISRKFIEGMFFDQATNIGALRDTLMHLINVGRLAERQITVDGRLIGSVLGTPATITRYPDAHLAEILLKRTVPPTPLDTDSSPSERQDPSPSI